MKIGYVHAGNPHHGVSRYGRLLAAETARRADVCVIEYELQLGDAWEVDTQRVAAIAAQLRGVDVVHLQYNNQRNGSVWGVGWRQLFNLRLFIRAVGRPAIVTVHDLYPLLGFRSLARRPIRSIRTLLDGGSQLLTMNWLKHRASQLLVCSQEERSRLAGGNGRVDVIPHFVEPRTLTLSRADAKAGLGWAGKRVITVLGYIHRRKGHQLVVDVLSHLPDDVIAVFAGGPTPSDAALIDRLHAQAKSRGVAHRLFFTGYLTEFELERHLIAADVGVCPFVRLSASGSLSTWISAARPIVASNLPQIREYNAIESGAIATFEPYVPSALAAAIHDALERNRGELDETVARLRTRLLLSVIADRHIDTYRELLRRHARAMTLRSVSAQA